MTIDERRGQRRDSLLRVLRRELDMSDLTYSEEPTALTGGFWAELFVFRLANAPTGWDGRLVARIMPDAGIAIKEAILQGTLATNGYPTPMVRSFSGPESGVDGQALMVMDLATGSPPLSGLGGRSAIASLPSLLRRLPRLLADVLSELHHQDSALVCSRFEAEGVSVPGIDSMLASYEAAAAGFEDPSIRSAVGWLLDHRPIGLADVICHGDMHPFNVLVGAGERPTVLDWSAGVIAPREYDLGFTSLMLAEPPLLVPRGLRSLLRLVSAGLSRSFLRAYERQARVATQAGTLEWFQSLICVRALTEVAWWEAGGTLDEHAGHPWLINEPALIRRLQRTTGVAVAQRGSLR